MEYESTPRTELAKELGLTEALSIAIGAMIGGGIFTALGRVADLAGPFAVLSFFLGGLIAFLTAHSYVKLVSRYPSAGGEFVILRRGLSNPLFGNFVGMLLWLGYSVTIALYASTFGAYLAEWLHGFFPLWFFSPENTSIFTFRRLMSAFAIILFMLINLRGVKETGLVQNVIVAFKLGVLLLLSLVGFWFIATHFGLSVDRYVASWENVHQPELSLFGGIPTNITAFFYGVFVGGSIIFVSYEGFQVIANTVEELKNPARDVRLGMYISVVVVCITYLAVAFVAIAMIEGEIDETALIQAVKFLGPVAVTLITLGAVASTTSAINATLLGSSRLAYVMSDWQAFPKRLAVISKRTKVPYLAIIITSIISMLFTFLGSGAAIAEVASIIFLAIFLAINFSVVIIFRGESNKVSKFAVVLISADIVMAVYYAFFVEGQQFAIVVLAAFSLVTITWVAGNHIIRGGVTIDVAQYDLQPLGSELIKEFTHTDNTDIYFTRLEQMLVPVEGKVYETKNLQISAVLARKYGVKVTLLHITRKNGSRMINAVRNGFGNKGDPLEQARKIMETYRVNYEVVERSGKDIASTIVKVYREGDYQLISMASRRKRGIVDRLFEASVSKKVVNSVPCSVLQVQPPRYGAKNPEIGDVFVLMDGSERDEYLMRWAHLISAGGVPTQVSTYHVTEVPGTFPLDEAPKIKAIENSAVKFEDYAMDIGQRYGGMEVKPRFMVGHSFVKTISGEMQKYEPDALIVGHSKDRGLLSRFRAVKSQRLMNKVDSAVIVFHMPDPPKN